MHKAMLMLAGLLALLLAGCQSVPQQSGKTPARSDKPLTNWGSPLGDSRQESPHNISISIWDRIRDGYRLQQYIDDNPRVDQQRIGFLNRTSTIENLSQRSAPYIHYVVEQLEANDMPLELALLPMIESSYDPLAYSHAQAAGLWQFIPSTGRLFNLKQNSLYDGRRDVAASTTAAIAYLKRLHDLFNGDWLLALAAYNAGEGTVSRAIERNALKGLPTDYWNLPLPGETRNYVPRLLALSQIVQSPEAYGIRLADVANEPYFELVSVPGQIDLARIARISDMEETELLALNPAYKQRITPSGETQLLVPVDKADEISDSLDESGVQWASHEVGNGEKLEQIARRYHVSASAIREINHLRGEPRTGQTLRIPQLAPPGKDPLYARLQYEGPQPRSRLVTYRVRPGDTLSSIASRHKVSVRELRSQNRLRSDSLRVGQELQISGGSTASASTASKPAAPKAISYRVRSGETISSICRRHGVSAQDLQRWNPALSRGLKAGQTLTIHPPRR